MFYVNILLLWILVVFIVGYWARRRKRSALIWGLLALLFFPPVGIIGLLIIIFSHG